MIKLVISACLYCLLSLYPFTAQSDDFTKLEYLTESYPPYNYLEDGELKGIAVDLLYEVLIELNEAPQDIKIGLFPWPRAYQMLVKGSNQVLLSTTRTQEREALFQWAGPITHTNIVLLGLANNQIEIQSPQQLPNYTIGTIKDDIGEQLLLSLGTPKSSIRRAHRADSLAKMLYKGRIKLWAYEERVAHWYLNKAELDLKLFTSVFTLKQSELFFAFSKDIDPELVSRFQEALDKLKRPSPEEGDSRYQKILAKYQ
ncbi:ABC transporter substrate-binding protein [Shewanella sp. UCD-KL12]|uniref:substrate-binding periplasmic protein n=1 Tax=Shewanella sp. UCD-KL12 TaxID=1917163 RepID=UPI0009FAC0C8|nr:transporter substrate-binding domain-containing protein [Shewanella sp. UCD-KL12]